MNASLDAIANLVAWLVLAAIPALAIGGAIYIDLRQWWRARRNRIVLTCLAPRCVECAHKLKLVEPFAPNAVQQQRCGSCGVFLHCRRNGALWEICTVAEAKRQRTAPLPAVGPLRRAGQVLAAVFLNPPTGVLPGESALAQPTPVSQLVAPQAGPVELPSSVLHCEFSNRDRQQQTTGDECATTGSGAQVTS